MATISKNEMGNTEQKEEKDDMLQETEICELSISSLVTIQFEKENYLLLQNKKDKFVLYHVSVILATQSKTSFYLYLRYSDILKFHRQLEYFHNRLCKFNTKLKYTLFLPKLPPKKQWKRNKFDKTLIAERIRLLNVYVKELTKYVSKSTRKIQDLYLHFFEIDTSYSLYRYITMNDIEMLSHLHKYNPTTLLQFRDENKSNILHYIISQKSTQCMQFIMDLNLNLTKLFYEKDVYQITPLSLAKKMNKNNIYDSLLNKYHDHDHFNDDNKENKKDVLILPLQYTCNILQKKRKLWIIVNPFAGQGYSLLIWKQLVQKWLDSNADKIEYETLITTRQFHAQQECEKLSLSAYNNYDGIVCIGGDGTIAEVVNGLYHNTNLDMIQMKKLNKCITPISTGSGNALAKELGMMNICDALRRLLYGFETCIDACLASQTGERDTYSFVFTTWGTISSIDFESEWYRWMGTMRFTVKGVFEVASSSHYKARVYFKPIGNTDNYNVDINNNDRVANNDVDWWCKLPNYKERPQYPEDWICIEGEFNLLSVTNVQWIASDCKLGGNDFNVKTKTGLRLIYSEKTGRINYAWSLLGLESGKHLDLKHVRYCDVEQAVIEPLTKEGPPIDVDGERKPLKPVYVRLLPSHFVVTL